MSPHLLSSIIVLQMFLLSTAQHYLSVHPVDPVVSIGESIQLNCSINCPGGNVAWKGLDIYVDNQYTAPGYSVQTFENITVAMEGRKFCEGTCNGKGYQKNVALHVYALPKTLLLSNSMKNGVHYLNCSMEHVYPLPTISCHRGSEILGETMDSIVDHDDDNNLFNVTWSWIIHEEDWLVETSYRCQAQVVVNDQVLTREGTLNISKQETTTAVPASSTFEINSTQSQESELRYLTTTISASQTPRHKQWMQERTAPGSQQVAILNTVTTQSTARPISIADTTTSVTASSTSQVTHTLSRKSKTSYVTTNVAASQNPQTIQWRQKSTTTRSQQSVISSTVTTRSTQRPTYDNGFDGRYLMWTIVPVTGLVGCLLLSLQIYRQLSKKGFFQPNHTEFPKVQKDAKSQESLQAVFCSDLLPKKQFSTY